MHPYEIQRLLRERHKDELLVLKRGSLYHAIHRLLQDGFIEIVSTSRAGRRPERTTYRITESGERHLLQWLRQMVAIPRREASDFMTAVSFLVHLTTDEALAQLGERAVRLEREVAELSAHLPLAIAIATRVNLLESEYLLAMLQAELAWVRALADDIRSGRLTWDIETLLKALRLAHAETVITEESA
jgi:DNA-binding PadR family transcriptional regulator